MPILVANINSTILAMKYAKHVPAKVLNKAPRFSNAKPVTAWAKSNSAKVFSCTHKRAAPAMVKVLLFLNHAQHAWVKHAYKNMINSPSIFRAAFLMALNCALAVKVMREH